jgi:hypothetical protein
MVVANADEKDHWRRNWSKGYYCREKNGENYINALHSMWDALSQKWYGGGLRVGGQTAVVVDVRLNIDSKWKTKIDCKSDDKDLETRSNRNLKRHARSMMLHIVVFFSHGCTVPRERRAAMMESCNSDRSHASIFGNG